MISENLKKIINELPPEVKLVAVSKFHPCDAIREAYEAGQRCFAESRPQELAKKVEEMGLPDMEWHFIGHLQTNKLKMVLPYVDLVQSVDSKHLLDAINTWGRGNNKIVNVLLEMYVAAEDSKQGFVEEELLDILFNADRYRNIRFCGLMAMATLSEDEEDVRADFARVSDYFEYLKDLFPEIDSFKELSIGMSGDYRVALEYGSTMVRIGTAIFGERA